MKSIVLVTLMALSMQFLNAQIKAVTEYGDEIVVFDDGTWKYVNDSLSTENEIPLSEKEYVKDKKSTFLVKSSKFNVGIYINPKDWNFTKGSENEATEFSFTKKGDDYYAMMITEKISIPIESLKTLAYNNAKNAAPDIAIEKLEYRTVNGLKVLFMQMSGTMQGIRFTYNGYYYSNEKGTVQLVVYSGESLMKSNSDLVESFIDGFVQM